MSRRLRSRFNHVTGIRKSDDRLNASTPESDVEAVPQSAKEVYEQRLSEGYSEVVVDAPTTQNIANIGNTALDVAIIADHEFQITDDYFDTEKFQDARANHHPGVELLQPTEDGQLDLSGLLHSDVVKGFAGMMADELKENNPTSAFIWPLQYLEGGRLPDQIGARLAERNDIGIELDVNVNVRGVVHVRIAEPGELDDFPNGYRIQNTLGNAP